MITINTENILFICGGAFEGIQRIIGNRLNTRPIGFKDESIDSGEIDKASLLSYINALDLKNFGLIPELIGRLPVLTYLDPLNKETLMRILTEPQNALVKQYTKLFKMEKIDLEIKSDALEYIVEKAMDFNLGARGLRSICEAIMTDAMFELPSQEGIKKFMVTAAYAQEKIDKSKFNKLKVAS
jgi:ATP-dependent Clp protease ATP-binding subunit ClpX